MLRHYAAVAIGDISDLHVWLIYGHNARRNDMRRAKGSSTGRIDGAATWRRGDLLRDVGFFAASGFWLHFRIELR